MAGKPRLRDGRQNYKRFLLRLTPELHSRLHALAIAERRTITNMVNVLLEDELKRREPRPPQPAAPVPEVPR